MSTSDVVAADPAPYLPARPAHRPDHENPYLVYLGSLPSPKSVRTVRGCLNTVARIIGWHGDPADFPWEQIRYGTGTRLRSILQEQTCIRDGEVVRWAPSTVNKHLAALRGVLRAAWSLGYLTADEYARVRAALKKVPGSRLLAGRNIAAEETAAILRACLDGRLIGIRDAAIVALLCATGLRLAEVAAARREHYNPGNRSLRVIGKGNKERIVYLNEDAAVYLGQWLSRVESRTGPLFCPVNRWGAPVLRHLSERAIGGIIDRGRRRAGLPRLTPHDFRRTFIGDLLSKRVDLATVQKLAGHESASTTARYDRRAEEVSMAAAAMLELPRPEELTAGRSEE